MGQFDFASAAALDRIKMEALPTAPAARLTARIAAIGGVLAEAIGVKGASAAGDLYCNRGAKDASVRPSARGQEILRKD